MKAEKTRRFIEFYFPNLMISAREKRLEQIEKQGVLDELEELERLAEIGRVTEFAINSGYEFAWGEEYFMNFEQMKKTMELETSSKTTK